MAPGLLLFKRGDELLGLFDAPVLRKERDEIRERGDGLVRRALIVFGFFRLFVIGHPGAIDGVAGNRGPVKVTVRRHVIGPDGLGIFPFAFARRANPQLGVRGQFAEGPAAHNFLEHASGLIHGTQKGNVSPQLEPLPTQIAQGDGILALEGFVVVGRLGIFFQQLLILFEGLFVLFAGFVAPSDQVLGRRCVIRHGPLAHDAASGFGGHAVVSLIEGGLRHLQLILGAVPSPFTFAAHWLIRPAFPRPKDERGGGRKGQRQQAEAHQDRQQGPTFHADTVVASFFQVKKPAGMRLHGVIRRYWGSKSFTSARSSFNSFTVASIFPRLNSLSGTPCTISQCCPSLRTGNEQMRPFSIS
ncbi:MAG: hypothetical protein BWX84_02887 [Verrucomicrobia bacterium ADurb.Bin118]|nr:MAG: hypothetical protein BWX84_02887 [Verrucomicrobia bacterium ADurb.Bin118]